MPTAADRPLVTFAVIAYKQERFIREAIKGAFAQTYEPLEIILSDDGSPDRTFEIMQEMAAAYDGPHRVVLNRNTKNLGLIGHINHLVSLIETDIIILAAGDDISHPFRADILTAVFRSDPSIMAVLSDVDILGETEKKTVQPPYEAMFIPIETLLYHGGGVGIGASYAYRLACFRWPSKLSENILSEDRILPLRGALLGHVCRVSAPLVKYRRSNDGLVGKLRREQKWSIIFPQHIQEVEKELKVALKQNFITISNFEKLLRFYRFRQKIAYLNNKRGRFGDAVLRVIGKSLNWFFFKKLLKRTDEKFYFDAPRVNPVSR